MQYQSSTEGTGQQMSDPGWVRVRAKLTNRGAGSELTYGGRCGRFGHMAFAFVAWFGLMVDPLAG